MASTNRNGNEWEDTQDTDSKYQNWETWAANWCELHRQQLQKYRDCADDFLVQQHHALERILNSELSRQLKSMKEFFETGKVNMEIQEDDTPARAVSYHFDDEPSSHVSKVFSDGGFGGGLSILDAAQEYVRSSKKARSASLSHTSAIPEMRQSAEASTIPEAEFTVHYSQDWDTEVQRQLAAHEWTQDKIGKDFEVYDSHGTCIDVFSSGVSSTLQQIDFPLSFVKVTKPGQEDFEKLLPMMHVKSKDKRNLRKLFKQFRLVLGWGGSSAAEKLGKDHPYHSSSKVAPSRFQQLLMDFTNHIGFQVASALLIVANTVSIAFYADVAMKNAVAGQGDKKIWMKDVDLVFTILFTAELLVRVMAERIDFVCGPARSWNIFDTLIVVTSIVENFLENFNLSLSFMRVLRVFRLLRVLRVIRIFRIFRKLRLMVVSILTSLLTLTWAFVLLVLLMLCFAICFVQATASYLDDHLADMGEHDKQVYEQIVRHFKNLGTAMYTLLAVIAGGKEWDQVSQLLEVVGKFYQGLFLFYILFVMFGVLNVLTGYGE